MFRNDIILDQAQHHDSFYLYDQSVILDHIKALQENFSGIGFLYSIKNNPHPEVLSTVFGAALGADAASLGEVLLSRGHGLSPAQIQYSAPGKSRRDIEEAISLSTLVADSLNEVALINEVAKAKGMIAEIGVRINPNFTFVGEGGIPSKFGIDEDVAFDTIANWDALSNVKVVGIHVHARSQELNPDVLVGYYRKMFALAKKFQAALGHELQFMNMGSGIGIDYETSDTPLDIATLGTDTKAVLSAERQSLPNLAVYIESGRYIAGKSGVYVTKVLDKKVSFGKTFVILANTLNGFIRPSLAKLVTNYAGTQKPAGTEPLFTSKSAFQFIPLVDADETEVVTLVGNLCTGADVVTSDITLPTLRIGDVVVITNAGAYAAVLSPMQFSAQVPPAQLFLTTDGTVLSS